MGGGRRRGAGGNEGMVSAQLSQLIRKCPRHPLIVRSVVVHLCVLCAATALASSVIITYVFDVHLLLLLRALSSLFIYLWRHPDVLSRPDL